MKTVKHKDYTQESQKLAEIVEIVYEEKQILEKRILKVTNKIGINVKEYSTGNNLSFLELLAEIPTRTKLVEKYNYLMWAIKKPYFAKIDFREFDEKDFNSYYIGKKGIIRDEGCELVVVDWRAPIASLYYNGKLGKASYYAPDGKIEGDLLLKRQLLIEDAVLHDIVDIDITTRDEMLQRALGGSVNNRLRDIVETIQREQDHIIRHNPSRTTVVQGVAGSGKTTIALHRVAYLLYDSEENENTVIPERFMIVAPNKLFLSYISNVLPELGVDNIKQTTYEEFAFEVMGQTYPFISMSEIFNQIVNSNEKESVDIRLGQEFKGSLFYKNLLKDYLNDLIQNFFKREDFILAGEMVLSSKEIEKRFFVDYSYLPPFYRQTEIEKRLNNYLESKLEKLACNLETVYQQKVNSAKLDGQPREFIAQLIDEKNDAVAALKTESRKLKTKFKNIWDKKPLLQHYREFLEKLVEYAPDSYDMAFLKRVSGYSLNNIKNGIVEQSDLAPLVYISQRIYGLNNKTNIDHVLVDEAQDLSMFELFSLREFAKRSNSFTLVGDISQGIYSYKGIKAWEDLTNEVFDSENTDFFNLITSYRTTIEIMNFANGILRNLKNERITFAEPVIRNGLKPIVVKSSNISRLHQNIGAAIKILLEKEYKSIAVICKTTDEARQIYNFIRDNVELNVSLLSDSDSSYDGGVIFAAASLTKGLEFDAVIISNVGESYYKDDSIDIKLLYVSCTRALHILLAFCSSNITPILANVDSSNYNLVTSLELLESYYPGGH